MYAAPVSIPRACSWQGRITSDSSLSRGLESDLEVRRSPRRNLDQAHKWRSVTERCKMEARFSHSANESARRESGTPACARLDDGDYQISEKLALNACLEEA